MAREDVVSPHEVYAVHAVRPHEICSTEVIFTVQGKAESYAADLSTDPGVLAGVVTEFVLNSPGEKHSIAMYVKRARQEVPHLSDNREIAANGWLKSPTLWRDGRRI
jgi:hypothetical protein